MQGRRSQQRELLPLNDNIDRIRNLAMEDERNQEQNQERVQQAPNLVPNPVYEPEPIRTMKDYSRPVVSNDPLCIVLEPAARNYELKSSHYNQLPNFHGLPDEDILLFFREFYGAIQSFPNYRITENQLRMRCIPHALKGEAKAWLLTLPPASLRTWDEVREKLTDQYYAPQKTSEIRAKISSFIQQDNETFYEAWERFKKYTRDCPQHGFLTNQLCQWFYDGLTEVSGLLVNNACGGSMYDKQPDEVYEIFEKLAQNSRHKNSRRKKGIYTVDANTESSIQMAQMMKKIDSFATEFSQLKQKVLMGEHQAAGPGPEEEEVNAMNNFNPRPRNDPYSNTYNPGWRNHPNFSWSNNQNTGNQWGNNNSNQRQINTGAQQNFESQPKKPSMEELQEQM